MVQLKYFGDSRDYLKYDLITELIKGLSVANYVYIPMLTEHREDNEGQLVPKDRPDKSKELLAFIKSCKTKSLDHWERWLTACTYHTVEPAHVTFFTDLGRPAYWARFENLSCQKHALIFLDPDTGLETSTRSYMRKAGPEKYLLTKELTCLYNRLDQTSCLMIYQHLQRNRNKHAAQTEAKVRQALDACTGAFVSAYREDDLAFLMISKEKEISRRVDQCLREYHDNCQLEQKTIMLAPGNS